MKNIYIIDNNYVFDVNNNTIKSKGNEEFTILLPNASARLLSVLIQHSGETISRDKLLKVVWDDHGFKGTGNNLNSYISQLRAKISEIGMSGDTIKTIPKQGFRLNADVRILKTEVMTVVNENIGNRFVIYEKKRNPIKKKNVHFNIKAALNEFSKIITHSKLLILMGIVFIFIIIHSLWKKENHEFGVGVSYLLQKNKDCTIYTLLPFQNNDIGSLNSQVTNTLRKHGIDCTNGKKIIFFMNAKNNKATNAGTILSVCFFDKVRGKYYECKNIRDPK